MASQTTYPITTIEALPTASADQLNRLYRLRVAATADKHYVCRKTAAGGHQWFELAPGSPLSVLNFGAKGDGVTDDRAAFVDAAAEGPTLLVPYTAAGYKFGSTWTVPADTRIVGLGPRKSRLLHAFNGDFLTLSDGAILEHIWLDGQGGTFSGKGLLFTGSDGHQKLLHCQVTDFADFCLDFAVGAGSLSSFIDVEMWQTDGASAGKYAVNISSTQQLSAKPRKFVAIETAGKKFINFGGCNNVYVVGSFVGELKYTAETRAALVVGSRVGVNETAMDVDGHDNAIVGCDVGPAITVLSGADNIAIQGNSYNTSPYITDNSGNPRNLLDTWGQAYTPTLATSGTAPSLGNGTLTGWWSRSGSVITATILFTFGSTTSLGTGEVRLGLPKASGVSVQIGAALAADSSAGTSNVLAAVISSAAAYATFRADGSTAVSATVPFTWATDDTLRCTVSYSV